MMMNTICTPQSSTSDDDSRWLVRMQYVPTKLEIGSFTKTNQKFCSKPSFIKIGTNPLPSNNYYLSFLYIPTPYEISNPFFNLSQ